VQVDFLDTSYRGQGVLLVLVVDDGGHVGGIGTAVTELVRLAGNSWLSELDSHLSAAMWNGASAYSG
jgi:hypothetical protein